MYPIALKQSRSMTASSRMCFFPARQSTRNTSKSGRGGAEEQRLQQANKDVADTNQEAASWSIWPRTSRIRTPAITRSALYCHAGGLVVLRRNCQPARISSPRADICIVLYDSLLPSCHCRVRATLSRSTLSVHSASGRLKLPFQATCRR